MSITSHRGFLVEMAAKCCPAEMNDFMDDLVQEGYMGLMRAEGRFEEDRGVKFLSYGAWWVKAYMHRFIDRERSNGRLMNNERYEEEAGYTSIDDFHFTYPLPDEVLLRKEMIDLVRKALQVLPTKDVVVIREYFWNNKTLYEIGEELGLSHEAVRQRIYRSLDKMKRYLANHGLRRYNYTKANRRLKCQGERW